MKNVLITGGTGGIGQAIIKSLTEGDYKVAIHYNKNETLAKDMKRKHKDKCEIFKSDLLYYQSCIDLVNTVSKTFKTIDILINNAGAIYGPKAYWDLGEEDFDRTLNINFKSVFFVSQQIFKNMVFNNLRGKIINISSISAKYGGGQKTFHYGCAKAAVECFTKGLAKIGADKNILVNCVQLGFVDTLAHKKIGRTEKDIIRRIEKIPLKRAGKPEEVASLIYYLCSEAANFITGQIFTISGGD